jgi:hypothetical protein
LKWLSGAGESMAGASIGGGVGSGVGCASAVGAGPVSQVDSGVVGGFAGRIAIRRKRNRTRNTGEAQTLLENGNRLGGNRETSRLVHSEISQTFDPATGDITT